MLCRGESEYNTLDNTLIRSIGWKPVFKDNEAVAKSVSNWYNNYIEGSNMKNTTLAQIEDAFNKL